MRRNASVFMACVLANDHHQRWEPAAEDSRIVTGLNGWLPSAAWNGWAIIIKGAP